MDLMHMEDEAARVGAKTKAITRKISSGREDKGTYKERDLTVHMPKTLEDAVKIEGEREVFGRYLNALAVAQQSKARQELKADEEKASGSRASYVEQLMDGE